MLDHLVYLVTDLPAAITHFARLGLPFTTGGQHPERGTHNALLRLASGSYLELLAVDPATTIPAPRWMGIDQGELPRISRWAVHAGKNDFPEAPWQAGARQLPNGQHLRWQLTDPGTTPAIDALPFLIDWGKNGVHPTDNLPEVDVELLDLHLYTPDAAAVNARLARVESPYRAIPAAEAHITATLRGPHGVLQL